MTAFVRIGSALAITAFTVCGAYAQETSTVLSGVSPIPEGANVAEVAAWTVVGNVLLNLDEMLMKR